MIGNTILQIMKKKPREKNGYKTEKINLYKYIDISGKQPKNKYSRKNLFL